MSIALAFLRRDFLIWTSYRLSLLSQVLGSFALIGIIYFIGRTVEGNVRLLEKYGGDYVAFLLSGLAFTSIFTEGLNSLPRVIRENQQTGTLETMLLTPVRLIDFIVASSLFGVLLSLVRSSVIFLFGVLVLGFWRDASLISILAVFIPAVLAMFSIGVLSAAFVVLVKQADAVIAAYGAMAAILGGMLFPVEALPNWLRPLSALVPLSHALSGLRLALQGEPPSAIAPQALALLFLAAALLPISIATFNWAINRAKKEGSLAQY